MKRRYLKRIKNQEKESSQESNQKKFPYDKLIIQSCQKEDFNEVMQIIKDTKMDIWLSNNVDFSKYFIVRDSTNGKLVLCFTFSQENEIGILKNLIFSTIFRFKRLIT